MFNSYFIFRIENNSMLHYKDLAASIIRGMIRQQVPLISVRLQAGLTIYAILLSHNSKIYTTFWICDNFWFNAIWHTWSTLEASRSDITVTLSVTCMDRRHWRYNHAVDAVLPSSVVDFVIRISEKHKSTSPTAIRRKNWCKAISTEE